MQRQRLASCPTEEPALAGAALFAIPETLVRQGGPAPADDRRFQRWLDDTAALVTTAAVTNEEITAFWRAQGPEYLAGCAQGHALAKPRGYAGDFQMMDLIYDHRVSDDPRFAGWDRFFQQQAACRAVRNRAAYLTAVLERAAARRGGKTLRVLDLACGSARHLGPWLHQHGGRPFEILCVDSDPEGLERAAEVCRPAGPRVRLLQADVLRMCPASEHDVVWSSGLFDYFSDATFVRLARRLLGALVPGGELVIGNFGLCNPTRAYMELVGDWRLRHRGEDHLLRLGAAAGAAPERLRVGRDRTGVNLFLHLRAPGAR